MELLGATATHVGNVRESNQDRGHFGGYVAVVADGMGGHQGGETAAMIAISEFVGITSPVGPSGLVELVEDANRAVFERAAEPDLRGMGTTLVALTLRPTEHKVSIVNVGDSRAYFLRGKELGRLTYDHSLVEDLVRQKRLTPEEALHHPQRNILTRALGIASHVEVDQFLAPTKLGDRFLLCSDGLFNEVSEDDILRLLLEHESPLDAAEALVSAALSGAGRDNITVVVVDVVDDGQGGSLNAQVAVPSHADTVQAPVVSPLLEADPQVAPGSPNGGPAGPVASLAHEPQGAGPLQRNAAGGNVLELEAAEAGPGPLLDNGIDTAPVTVTVPVVAVGPGPSTSDPFDDHPRSGRRAVRLVAMGVVLGALAAGAYLGVQWYNKATWFVEPTAGQVAVYNGRPGGFLWAGPEQKGDSGPPVADLTDEAQATLAGPPTFNSEAEALAFVAELEVKPDMAEPAQTLNDVQANDTVPTTAPATVPSPPPAPASSQADGQSSTQANAQASNVAGTTTATGN